MLGANASVEAVTKRLVTISVQDTFYCPQFISVSVISFQAKVLVLSWAQFDPTVVAPAQPVMWIHSSSEMMHLIENEVHDMYKSHWKGRPRSQEHSAGLLHLEELQHWQHLFWWFTCSSKTMIQSITFWENIMGQKDIVSVNGMTQISTICTLHRFISWYLEDCSLI